MIVKLSNDEIDRVLGCSVIARSPLAHTVGRIVADRAALVSQLEALKARKTADQCPLCDGSGVMPPADMSCDVLLCGACTAGRTDDCSGWCGKRTESEVDRLTKALAAAERDRDAAESAYQSAAALNRDAAKEKWAAVDIARGELMARIDALVAQLEVSEATWRDCKEANEGLADQLAELTRERDEARAQLEMLEPDQNEVVLRLETTEAKNRSLESEVARLTAELESLRNGR